MIQKLTRSFLGSRLYATFRSRPAVESLEDRVRTITHGPIGLTEPEIIPPLMSDLQNEIERREASWRPSDRYRGLDYLKSKQRDLYSTIVSRAYSNIVQRKSAEIREQLEQRVTKYLSFTKDDNNIKDYWFRFASEALDENGTLKTDAFKDLFEYAKAWKYDLSPKNPDWDFSGRDALFSAVRNYLLISSTQNIVVRKREQEISKALVREIASFDTNSPIELLFKNLDPEIHKNLGLNINNLFLGTMWQMTGMFEKLWDRKDNHKEPELTSEEAYKFIINARRLTEHLLHDENHSEIFLSERGNPRAREAALST